jgi:nucleoside diphosphate kinase
MNLQIMIGDATSHDNKPNDVRMDYSVEYLNDIITLADGVAYYTKTISL